MTLVMCPRCNCCSLMKNGKCFGACDEDGHTEDDLDDEKEYLDDRD